MDDLYNIMINEFCNYTLSGGVCIRINDILEKHFLSMFGIDSPILRFSPLPLRQYWPSLKCIWCHIQYLLPHACDMLYAVHSNTSALNELLET